MFEGRLPISNRARGTRAKSNQDDPVPPLIDPDLSSKEARKTWAYLIRKIYETDPLVCPKCQGFMRVISFIQDSQAIRQILEHLGLWLANARASPRALAPPAALTVEPHATWPDPSDLPTLEWDR